MTDNPDRFASLGHGLEACGCGWPLPASLAAYRIEESLSGVSLPGIEVRLGCPCCGQGHRFFNAEDPASVAAFHNVIDEKKRNAS